MLLSAVFILFGLAARAQATCSGVLKNGFPFAPRNLSVVDNYNGTEVVDPYRWLEDPDSAQTRCFIEAQNNLSRSFFHGCPFRSNISERLTVAKNYPRYSCPERVGGKYYYTYNPGLDNHDVMYMQDDLNSQPSVFLDPNRLSYNRPVAFFKAASFSKDGTLYVYGLWESGFVRATLKVRNVSDGLDLSDTVNNVMLTLVAWTPDNQGFFYSTFSVTNHFSNHCVYYHRLGTNQDKDEVVFSTPDTPNYLNVAHSSDDGHYLVVVQYGTSGNRIFIGNMHTFQKCSPLGLWTPTEIVDNNVDLFAYITNIGPEFIFLTNKDAPNYRLIRMNISNPQQDKWETLVPENSTKGLLTFAKSVNDKLILYYKQEAKTDLFIHDLYTGREEYKVSLKHGSLTCMTGQTTDKQLFFRFASLLEPSTIYYLDMDSYNTTAWKKSKVSGFQSEDFETHQLFYTSYDNTTVPMFVVHRKGLVLTGNHPVLLHGFGGFGALVSPDYNSDLLVFLHHLGGVYAVANIRGGLMYGGDWHKAGILGNRQKHFDDFQAAAEFLIASNYTNSKKLAIYGRSQGGLLVAASLNQKPHLFAAGVVFVGILDILRYQKFPTGSRSTWAPELGSSDNSTQFAWLYKYSPLHNMPNATKLKGDSFPATLVMTTDKGNNIPSAHSLKYTAQLQYSFANDTNQVNPLLLRVGIDGRGPSTSVIEEMTDFYSFISQCLELQWRD